MCGRIQELKVLIETQHKRHYISSVNLTYMFTFNLESKYSEKFVEKGTLYFTVIL